MQSSPGNIKNVTSNPISRTFFSKDNRIILQNAIRHGVWMSSNRQFVIGGQSNTQLEIIMRSIYLQYATHRPTDIAGQIEALNSHVTEHAIPNILTNLKQHKAYQKDIDSGVHVMEHPKNVSNAGVRSLPSQFFS
jgi:hypothetical protein